MRFFQQNNGRSAFVLRSSNLADGGRVVLFGVLSVALVHCSQDPGGGGSTGGTNTTTGGVTSTGGVSATGGTTMTGGVPSTGGVTATGGAPSTGGLAATGGSTGGSATGGTTSTGGSATTGGGGAGGAASGAGNTSGGAGGSSNSGGSKATGGAGGASAGANGGGSSGAGGTSSGGSGGAGTTTFTLASNNHMEGAQFAAKYTCSEKGFQGSVLPELHWTDGPTGTKSYAITFIDTTLAKKTPPDAKGYHWVLYNIPATIKSLPEGLTDAQAKALPAKENSAFLGPCPNYGTAPPTGANTDNYEFTIYALSTETIDLGTSMVVQSAETKLEAMNLAKAKLTGKSNAANNK